MLFQRYLGSESKANFSGDEMMHRCRRLYQAIGVSGLLLLLIFQSTIFAQQFGKKIRRATAPKLNSEKSDLYFENLADAFADKAPSAADLANAGKSPANTGTKTAASSSMQKSSSPSSASEESSSGGDKAEGWAALISAATLEDEVKQAKQRLDQIVTTPSKFAGGGFTEARLQFTELTILFGIIADYPSQVRWQKSALLARDAFAKIAANAKVGSTQAYNEAKTRLAELGDLLNGTELAGEASEEAKGWETLVDRAVMMQLFEVAYTQNLQTMTANANAFKENSEEVLRFSELLAAYTDVLNKEGMADADDPDYRAHSDKMLADAIAVAQAVKTDNADGARQAVAQIGASCTNCHNAYR
jgi:hypothetical protein